MKIFIVLFLALEVYGEVDVFDYIIVGAGPAGLVLANRLSARPEIEVLILEAGKFPKMQTDVPLQNPLLQKNSEYGWKDTIIFPKQFVIPEIERSPVPLPQGRVVGGSSIINSMLYVRGNRKDYNNWEENGACGWGWRDVFPFFMKSERNRDPQVADNGYHGKNGELFVQRPDYESPLKNKYLQAFQELGFKIGDVNGENQSVFNIPQINSRDGKRWGVDKAFLHPILGRRNLRLITSAYVTRIIFGIDNSAFSVEYEYKNKPGMAFIKEEVIISAGAIGSPHLLLTSGIGSNTVLEEFQILSYSNIPVGENLQDHPVARIPIYKLNESPLTENDFSQYFKHGKGRLSSVPIEAQGFFSSVYNQDPDWPDTEISLSTFLSSTYSTWDQTGGVIFCDSSVQRPKSRGKVTLFEADPRYRPIIMGNYLKEEEDVEVMVEGLKMCEKLASTSALTGVGQKLPLPWFEECDKYPRNENDYYRCLVIMLVQPSYDFVGTCKMGDPKDESTVVDFELKVKGMKRLRVVDTSIAPDIITGHTQALAILIGEKAADFILKDYYLQKWKLNHTRQG